MSSLSVSSIVGDPVNGGVVNIEGYVNVANLTITNNAESTTIDTGSLVVGGGLGVTKSVSIGGNIRLFGASNSFSTVGGSSRNRGLVLSPVSTEDVSLGSSLSLCGSGLNAGNARLLVPTGAVFSIESQAPIAQFASSDIRFSCATYTPALFVTNTGDATSFAQGGAVTISGGLAVAKSLYTGANLHVTGTANCAKMSVSSTEDATGSGTGSIVSAGGVAIQKTLRVLGSSLLATTDSSTMHVLDTGDSALICEGGILVNKGLVISGKITGNNASFAGPISVTSTVASTSTTTGAVTVTGGVGITGAVFSASTFTNSVQTETLRITTPVSGTMTETTALGNGAVVFESGLSVARSVFVGGNITVTGATNLANTNMTGLFRITNTTDSTTAATGALVCQGGVGIAGNVTVSGDRVVMTGTTNATSSTTGTLVLSGGMGVAKNAYIGANALITGTLSVGGATSLTTVSVTGTSTTSGIASFGNTTDSTDAVSGAVVVSGGLGVSKRITSTQLVVTGAVTLAGSVSMADLVTMSNTTDATSVSQASLVLSGGLAIAKSARIGGNCFVTGNTTLTGALNIGSTVNSANTVTGAFVLSGGMGLTGNIFAGGTLNVSGASNLTSITVSSTSTFSGAATFSNGITSNTVSTGAITVSGSTNLAGTTVTGQLNVTVTTESTSATTGAVVVSGGLAVAKQAYFNSQVTVTGSTILNSSVTSTSTLDSASSGTGALVTAGGLGVGKSVYVGGTFNVTGNSTFSGTMNSPSGQLTLNNSVILDTAGLISITSAAPGLRIAGNATVKTTRYVNSVDLFALGASYTDTNHEALQLTTTSTDTFTILSRNAGTGLTRKLVLQSGGSNTGQLSLNTNGTVALAAVTTDSTASTNGSVTVSGGLGVAKSITVGTSLRLSGSTNVVSISAAAGSSTYSLVLPTGLPVAANYALTSDTNGNLQWSEMVTTNPAFSSINVTSTDDATLTGQGSIRTAGGIYAAKSIISIGNMTSGGFEFRLGSGDQQTRGTSNLSRALVKDTSSTLVLNYANDFTGGTRIDSVLTISDTTASVSTSTGSLKVLGGLAAAKSIFCDTLFTAASGLAAPSFTTRSAGTRFILSQTLASQKVDCALGVTADSIWYASSDVNTEHRWYTGETKVMSLTGASVLTVSKIGLSSTNTNSVKLGVVPGLTNSYTLTLPAALPSSANYALVSDTQGQLSFSEMVTSDPTFTTVRVNQTLILKGSSSGTVSLQAPSTSSSPIYTFPGAYPQDGQVLASDANGNLSWTDQVSKASFSIPTANNTTATVTGLILTGIFHRQILVKVVANSVTSIAMYTLRGYPNATNSAYILFQSYVGDDTGYIFTIDNNGQISYTSTNLTSWTSGTISWYGQNPYDKISNVAVQSTGQNNVTTPTNVDRLILYPPQFSIIVLVTVNNTDSSKRMVAQYKLDGAYQPSGQWVLHQLFTGPDTGITFSILSSGQIQYVSTNVSGWVSTTFQFFDPAKPLNLDASFTRLTVLDGGMTLSGSSSTGPLAMYNASMPLKKWTTGPDASGNYNTLNDNSVGVILPYGSSSWVSTSDASMKKNIASIDGNTALDYIGQMNPITYTFNEDPIEQPPRYGLIAQELETILPELVTKYSGKKGISYLEIIPILIAAVKELQDLVADLRIANENGI